jgi:phosphoribosyl 1,2-cyclic phosphodiesterase
MKVTCYGPRGSIPAPSTEKFSTFEYGGDTSCYFVEAGPFRIILDCGSGIRQLGNDLMAQGKGVDQEFIILLSHYHWDHIQGLPFFTPVFIGANRINFHGFVPAGHEHGVKPAVEQMLQHQQSSPHFPVAHGALPSRRDYWDHARQTSERFWYLAKADGTVNYMGGVVGPADRMDPHWLRITTIPLNHPDGCLGYRIEYQGKVLVYASDNEPLRKPNAMLVKHAQEADLAIFDGQYTEEQLAGSVQGYGHGSPESCVDQAKACETKRLRVHHFDPGSSDSALDEMERQAQAYAREVGYTGSVDFAYQGAVWEID